MYNHWPDSLFNYFLDADEKSFVWMYYSISVVSICYVVYMLWDGNVYYQDSGIL